MYLMKNKRMPQRLDLISVLNNFQRRSFSKLLL